MKPVKIIPKTSITNHRQTMKNTELQTFYKKVRCKETKESFDVRYPGTFAEETSDPNFMLNSYISASEDLVKLLSTWKLLKILLAGEEYRKNKLSTQEVRYWRIMYGKIKKFKITK